MSSLQTIHQEFDTLQTPESVTRFIAMQGPLPNTSEDFWEMILQYRCPYIVMLTGLADHDNNVKCGDYFQLEDGPSEFGDIIIVTKSQVTTDTSLVLRCIDVKNKTVRRATMPDHGVPNSTAAVLEIFHTVSGSFGPVVVHCSAGIGRTGTYCLIHNTIQRLLLGDFTALDLADTVTTFRSQRYEMVQQQWQYEFSYEAILDGLKSFILNNQTFSDS
ncbi:hypothetical protein SASPL_104271 [Salvia splendens]|uniref:Uncharacterized protein n=1 Tax=Salvia splendens TaxID=180675 RepID=A0A8X9A8A9_SALSN|nr:hypothetical protein SASPL_104271 [Salvia splendens]